MKANLQTAEIEEAIIGGLLFMPRLMDEFYERINEDIFYNQDCKDIFLAIRSIYETGENNGNIMVTYKYLRENGRRDINPQYLFKCQEMGLGIDGRVIASLLPNLLEHHLQRITLLFAEEIKRDVLINHAKIDELQRKMFDTLQRINNEIEALAPTSKKLTTLKDFATDEIEKIKRQKENPKPVLTFGLQCLDNILGGLYNSDLTGVAGRPGMAKTVVLTHIATENAKLGFKVGIISLEMSGQALATREMIKEYYNHTGLHISTHELRGAKISDEDLEKVTKVVGKLPYLDNIFVDDTSALRIGRIKQKARKWKDKHGLDLLLVDYLQLAQPDGKHNRKDLEITEIAEGLKAIAKDLDIPVVVLSQLNRAVETRNNKKPMLSDLRESGGIEQALDNAILLFRPEYYGINQDEEGNPTANKIEYLIAKQRNGKTGEVSGGVDLSTFRLFDTDPTIIKEIEKNNTQGLYF